MKKLFNFIKNLPVQIFGASMGVIAITTMIAFFGCMILCAVLMVFETSSFFFNTINMGLKKLYNILSTEYQSNNILFIKYVCVMFVAFVLLLLLCKYVYNYKKIKKSISHIYIPYTDLTEEQKKMIPELFKFNVKLAYLRMKCGVVSLNTILNELKCEMTKNEALHPNDIKYILQKIPYEIYEDFGRSMSLLEWIDYYSIQKEIGLDYLGKDLSNSQRDLITVNVPIVKRYFIDSVKHGMYDEELIISDIDKRFSSILKNLCFQDRNSFLSLIPNLYCTIDGAGYALHEYLIYAKGKKPDYIEGNLF